MSKLNSFLQNKKNDAVIKQLLLAIANKFRLVYPEQNLQTYLTTHCNSEIEAYLENFDFEANHSTACSGDSKKLIQYRVHELHLLQKIEALTASIFNEEDCPFNFISSLFSTTITLDSEEQYRPFLKAVRKCASICTLNKSELESLQGKIKHRFELLNKIQQQEQNINQKEEQLHHLKQLHKNTLTSFNNHAIDIKKSISSLKKAQKNLLSRHMYEIALPTLFEITKKFNFDYSIAHLFDRKIPEFIYEKLTDIQNLLIDITNHIDNKITTKQHKNKLQAIKLRIESTNPFALDHTPQVHYKEIKKELHDLLSGIDHKAQSDLFKEVNRNFQLLHTLDHLRPYNHKNKLSLKNRLDVEHIIANLTNALELQQCLEDLKTLDPSEMEEKIFNLLFKQSYTPYIPMEQIVQTIAEQTKKIKISPLLSLLNSHIKKGDRLAKKNSKASENLTYIKELKNKLTVYSDTVMAISAAQLVEVQVKLITLPTKPYFFNTKNYKQHIEDIENILFVRSKPTRNNYGR